MVVAPGFSMTAAWGILDGGLTFTFSGLNRSWFFNRTFILSASLVFSLTMKRATENVGLAESSITLHYWLGIRLHPSHLQSCTFFLIANNTYTNNGDSKAQCSFNYLCNSISIFLHKLPSGKLLVGAPAWELPCHCCLWETILSFSTTPASCKTPHKCRLSPTLPDIWQRVMAATSAEPNSCCQLGRAELRLHIPGCNSQPQNKAGPTPCSVAES